jgi:uncharacterized protein (TIGR01777 family)
MHSEQTNSDPFQHAASQRPRVVIPGGSGFLGRSLSRHLIEHGCDVIILSRTPGRDEPHLTWRAWDNRTVSAWKDDLDGAAAVVNLVGRSVDCRKTPAQRAEILNSRLDSVRVLGEAMRAIDRPPPVWIQSGSAHIHGDPIPENTLIEDGSPIGTGFAPEVCTQWEVAYHDAKLPEQRGVILRTSFVLGPHGGAMDRLIRLTKLGLGGRIGSGRQYISWIHVHDMDRLIHACIEDESYEGTYIVTAPDPVTNARFMQLMRTVWNRPWSPPAPAFAVKIGARWLLNTDPELALLGRRCMPTRLLQETDFEFAFPDLEPALRDIKAHRP